MAAKPKPKTPDHPIRVRCITHNVHLGDGRQLHNGDEAEVSAHLAALLLSNGQVEQCQIGN